MGNDTFFIRNWLARLPMGQLHVSGFFPALKAAVIPSCPMPGRKGSLAIIT